MSIEQPYSVEENKQLGSEPDKISLTSPDTLSSPNSSSGEKEKKLTHTTFSAFQHRSYRLMWIGSFISNMGTWSQRVAEPWLVFNLSGSAFLLGLNGFAAESPLLAFLLLGGVLADRTDRKKALIIAQLVQMLSALAIMSLALTDSLTVWLIIALSFVVGCAQSVSTPAYLSILPSLVSRENLTNAIALNSTQFNLSRLIGPVIGGILLTSIGAAWCFGVNALSYAAVIFVLAIIAVPKADTQNAGEDVWKSMREGLLEVASKKELVTLIIIICSVSFFAGPLLTFLPVLAKEVLHVDAQGFSIALACFGGGAVVGALIIASAGHIENRFRIVIGATALLGASLIAISFSNSYLLSLVFMAIAGIAFVGCGSLANTIMQTSVSDRIRGRAVSIYALAFRGGLPLGNLVAGALIHSFNVQLVLGLNGLALLIILFFTYQFGYRKYVVSAV
ncbi:major facilitator superfamily MFS_1 [Chloroherpeton thalassium ATCC 35110]|uniref:Major facilitator superfamily MFS_1 n=1 Tax=Chloroherpeton thalassium (strain ATCC 35110 / GB-78) TaxID=517418 RepID=B3QWU4_CHLT3|nr:MFS transporter [Chloroherpeton thalassium]ACF13308.1 major facilitator superfamily MFS_1 [Chloroherpeton thalassium ATCC 35110]